MRTQATPRANHKLRGARRKLRGFTILELMVSMGIFTVLGTMIVMFMQRSLHIFSVGTQESAMYDRMDAVLPRVREDLEALFIGDQWDAPRPPPSADELMSGAKKRPPLPTTAIRFRAGHVKLKNLAGDQKDFLAPFFAFVTANASEWSDAQLRRAGETVGGKPLPITPESIEKATDATVFQAVGGLLEIVWIAIPDEDSPSIMTLYRGFRGPVGHPTDSLLDPANLDTIAKIKKACRPVSGGVLHFGALWRRAGTSTWEPSIVTGRGENDEYVGARWDSTRGLDSKFPFHRRDSAGDPSDDIFPAFVKLNITLVRSGRFGFGRGELYLRDGIDSSGQELIVSDTNELLGPGGEDRYFKIGSEWIGYTFESVDVVESRVRVRRGRRDSKKASHVARDWIFIGSPSETIMQLPVFRDSYAIPEDKR